jgi:hypothetical protein
MKLYAPATAKRESSGAQRLPLLMFIANGAKNRARIPTGN